jgi:uncharacterized protein (DUF1015 family)
VDPSLRLEPFRGVRYRPGIDLAAVTAPPYDVLDDAAVRSLAAEPHNLVRLLLPQGTTREAALASARDTLDRWLDDGTLRVDAMPGLYVYEEASAERVLLRGVIGTLVLPPSGSAAVLPHEDVMAPVVADRAELQSALQAQVEPIWLVYDGGGPASAVVEETATLEPLEECVTRDGTRHRLWAVTDRAQLAAVREDLAGRQAMIADGHHRFAAYRRVAEAAEDGAAGGPSDSGLALLVDSTLHPPGLAAIHRVVRGLGPRQLSAVGEWKATPEPVADWRRGLASIHPGALLVVDRAGRAHRVDLPQGADRRAL